MQRVENFVRPFNNKLYFVTIKYDSKLLKILKVLGLVGSRFIALTIKNTIHVTGTISKLSDHAIDHEFKHVLQWNEMGVFKFIVKYFYYMVKYGYDKHPLEQEAREFSGEPLR